MVEPKAPPSLFGYRLEGDHAKRVESRRGKGAERVSRRSGDGIACLGHKRGPFSFLENPDPVLAEGSALFEAAHESGEGTGEEWSIENNIAPIPAARSRGRLIVLCNLGEGVGSAKRTKKLLFPPGWGTASKAMSPRLLMRGLSILSHVKPGMMGMAPPLRTTGVSAPTGPAKIARLLAGLPERMPFSKQSCPWAFIERVAKVKSS